VRARATVCALVACAAALAAGQSPAGACACGIAIDASVSEERALVIEHNHSEAIVLSLDLASDDPQARAAVVVPVPGQPTVAAIERGDPLAYLERATRLRPPARASGDGESAGAGVDVIGREEIGGYDVARLGAATGAALNRWLDDNGYALPEGAEPILSDYAEEGWRFVAIRLAPGSEGSLQPLKIAFDTEEPVYPMRLQQLATRPLSLTLFVLAPEARRVKGLETTFSRAVDELEPPPPPRLEELFGGDDHVTRIEARAAEPASFRKDLAIEPLAATPAPPPNRDDDGLSTLDFVLVAAGGLVVLAVAFAIQMRRRAL
jgi:hypothetical protein